MAWTAAHANCHDFSLGPCSDGLAGVGDTWSDQPLNLNLITLSQDSDTCTVCTQPVSFMQTAKCNPLFCFWNLFLILSPVKGKELTSLHSNLSCGVRSEWAGLSIWSFTWVMKERGITNLSPFNGDSTASVAYKHCHSAPSCFRFKSHHEPISGPRICQRFVTTQDLKAYWHSWIFSISNIYTYPVQ